MSILNILYISGASKCKVILIADKDNQSVMYISLYRPNVSMHKLAIKNRPHIIKSHSL